MTITRRTFLSLAGSTAIGVKTAHAVRFASAGPRLAYIAARGNASGLYVFAPRGTEWRLLHFVPAEEPVALTIHPSCRTLYALHEVATFRTLPRAYVSAYRIDLESQELTLVGVQPLSLSATLPRHFAISPNGRFLIASAHGGGAYNLFPLSDDGSIGRVCGIRKEVGCGPCENSQQSAHPGTALFTKRGDCIVAVDQGTDTISVLEAHPSLGVRLRCALPSGTGAHSLAIDHGSQLAFVSGATSQALLALRIDVSATAITHPVNLIAQGVSGPLAIHPRLQILYAATSRGVAVYDFHRPDQLRHLQHLDVQDGVLECQALEFAPSLDALFIPTRKGLLKMPAEPSSGLLHAPSCVSCVRDAQSVVFL